MYFMIFEEYRIFYSMELHTEVLLAFPPARGNDFGGGRSVKRSTVISKTEYRLTTYHAT